MSSSFKKAQKSKQRPHRERGQIKERESYGILEKKKDYLKRARHYKKKNEQLKCLRKKVLEKNPDEFHYKMIHNKLKDGEHFVVNPPNRKTQTDAQKKLIEGQDIKYINYRLQIEKKRVEKMSTILDLSEKPKNKKIIFVDSRNEKKRVKAKLKEKFQTGGCENDFDEVDIPEDILEYKLKKTEEYNQRCTRLEELRAVSEKLELNKNLASTKEIAPKKITEETQKSAAIYKWEAVRYK